MTRPIEKLKRRIEFESGHDCIRFQCVNGSKSCLPGSGGSHGRHGMNISWLVIGKKGAVQFLVYTGWMPEPGKRNYDKNQFPPMPADLGYHSKKPFYKGQTEMADKCIYIGCKCYYDGSGLNAEEPFRVLCNEGGDALWEYLERVYRAHFGRGKWPSPKPYKFLPR